MIEQLVRFCTVFCKRNILVKPRRNWGVVQIWSLEDKISICRKDDVSLKALVPKFMNCYNRRKIRRRRVCVLSWNYIVFALEVHAHSHYLHDLATSTALCCKMIAWHKESKHLIGIIDIYINKIELNRVWFKMIAGLSSIDKFCGCKSQQLCAESIGGNDRMLKSGHTTTYSRVVLQVCDKPEPITQITMHNGQWMMKISYKPGECDGKWKYNAQQPHPLPPVSRSRP